MNNNYFEKEKMEYEQIEIPEELNFVVHSAIAAAGKKRKKKAAVLAGRAAGIAAAALVLSLTLGANTSYAFAKAVSKIPVLKDVSQALTFRDYSAEIDADPDPIKPLKKHDKKEETQPDSQIAPVQKPEQEAAPEQEKTPFEKWVSGLTAEELKQMTVLYNPEAVKDAESKGTFESTVLLAQLSAEKAVEAGINGDVALYGFHENGSLTGVVVRMGDALHAFDWTYLGQEGMLPALSVQDLYETSEKQLVVYLYNGLGTGLPVKETAEQQIVVSGNDVSADSENTEQEKKEDIASESDGSETITVTQDSKAESKSEAKGDSKNDGENTGTVIIAADPAAEKPAATGKDCVSDAESETEETAPEAGEVIVVAPELTEAEKTCQVWVLYLSGDGVVANLFDRADYDPAFKRSEN